MRIRCYFGFHKYLARYLKWYPRGAKQSDPPMVIQVINKCKYCGKQITSMPPGKYCIGDYAVMGCEDYK